MNDQSQCAHVWTANSGKGGEPSFNIRMGGDPVMHVRCNHCGTRTFLTREQWRFMHDPSPREGGQS